jgi:predicted permease
MIRWLRKTATWLRSVFRRRELDQELDDEIAAHLEMIADENIAKGMTAEQARRAAKIELGGAEQIKESVRAARTGAWLDTLIQDVRFGARMLRKNPGFTAVTILTLALGIGANTAMFSVVEGILLAPLPYRHPDRLVTIWESNSPFPIDSISYPNFRDWQRDATTIKQMAAIVFHSYDLSSPGTPEHLDGAEVTAGFFSTLGIKFQLGRDFEPAEDSRGGAPVAIISNALWRERFEGSPDVVGKTVAMNGVSYTLVGVLPPNFYFTPRWLSRSDVYTPLGQGDPLMLDAREAHDGIDCIARLNRGVSLTQARAEMSTIQKNLDRTYPKADDGTGTMIIPLKQVLVGNVSRTLLLLFGAVGLLLLIAGANYANLLLARSCVRAREFAVRSALGASRARIVRQLVTESLILSIAGGTLGVLVAFWGIRPLLAAVPGGLPRSQNIAVNLPVLLFALGIAIVIGVVFGLVPALKGRNLNPQKPLKDGSHGVTHSRHRAQSIFVIAQTALTLVLLTGAGLLFRTIHNLWDVNPGFDAQHVLTFKVAVSSAFTKTPSSTQVAYRQLIDRFRNIPGVEAADFTNLVPLTPNDDDAPFWIDANRPASLQNAPRVLMFLTGPAYLRTMGIPLLRGRSFTAEDTTSTPCVTVIDSVFARTYFPHSNPLDHTLTVGFDPSIAFGPCRIIGVVAHVKHWRLGTTKGTQNEAYFSLYQDPDKWVKVNYSNTTMVVRTPLDMSAVMPAISAAADEAGEQQPVYDVQEMQDIVADSMSPQRFPMVLLAAFAGLALALVSVGIYGVISYSLTQRVHEIGIRMALGAQRADILRDVLGQGGRMALVGIAIGVVAALGLTRLMATMLFGVSATDPLTFAAVVALLLVVALLACWIPARKAMRVDPMATLRHE